MPSQFSFQSGLGGSAGILAVTTKATTYAATNADDIILVDTSSAAWTLTLPSAGANTGKVIRVLKTTSDFNALTVNSTSVNTQGESVTFASDGSAWRAIDRYIPSTWATYSPALVGFGTPSSVEFEWSRRADSINVRGKFTSGTATATEARLPFPTGVTSASTSKIPTLRVAGHGYFTQVTALQGSILVEPSVTYLTLGIQSASASGLTKVTGIGFLASGNGFSFEALSIPVTGWAG